MRREVGGERFFLKKTDWRTAFQNTEAKSKTETLETRYKQTKIKLHKLERISPSEQGEGRFNGGIFELNQEWEVWAVSFAVSLLLLVLFGYWDSTFQVVAGKLYLPLARGHF